MGQASGLCRGQRVGFSVTKEQLVIQAARHHHRGLIRAPGYAGTQLRLRTWPCNVRTSHVRLRTADRVAGPGGSEGVPGAIDTSLLDVEIAYLSNLLTSLSQAGCLEQKVQLLERQDRVVTFLTSCELGPQLLEELSCLEAAETFVLLSIIAAGQQHVLQLRPESHHETLRKALRRLASDLGRVDLFYNSIGGLIGYQRKCLEVLRCQEEDMERMPSGSEVLFHLPQGPNLADDRRLAAQAAATGLEALPHMAEIYPVGGAGDRLGLKCHVTGESVPTAILQYCGRTLMEGLIRDLQAKEYLHFRLTGRQHLTPVAIMTSDAKGNHHRMLKLMKEHHWFGRGKESFRLFRQPLVPVVASDDGKWLLPSAMAPMMKPGGHGAIWKLMLDEGIFSWLEQKGRVAAIIRQISNPLAGTDSTLLALAGTGYSDMRSFGFACCERAVGAAEGMNVLMERKVEGPDGPEYAYNVTNLEYTEFERYGICDECAEGSEFSRFPANTNVLYVSLKEAEGAVKAGVQAGGGAALPGMIFNTKKKVKYHDAVSQQDREVFAGRMECTMQNLVDSMPQRFREKVPGQRHSELSTFVVFNKRRRVTSSAKRKRKEGSLIMSQTPEGSFYDLMTNAAELLARCGMTYVPEVGDKATYLEQGPGLIFLYHPALGPLWDVIAQKIRGGSLADRSEMVLEVAEAEMVNVNVQGSLLVMADCAMGRVEDAIAVNYDTQLRSRIDLQVHHVSGHRILYSVGGRSPWKGHRTAAADGGALQHTWSQNGQLRSGARDVNREPARPSESARLVYSNRCGRIRMNNVTVRNAGINWENPDNCYWSHKVERVEHCVIKLEGCSEFEASDVVLDGSQQFLVPDGYKMEVSMGAQGNLRQTLTRLNGTVPSWEWHYRKDAGGNINLHMETQQGAVAWAAVPPSADSSSFMYII